MKRKILLIFVLLIIFGVSFFYYSNKKIEGLWIKHYSIDLTDNTHMFSGSPLLDINSRKLNYYYIGSKGVPYTITYFSYGKTIGTWSDRPIGNPRMTIEEFDKDSIVFGGQESFNEVYKKIPDSLKNNSDWNQKLLHKVFEFKLAESTDTIFFDNDYLMSTNSLNPYRKWDSQGWELMKINGFDIMLTGNWTTFILQEKNDKILFYGFDNKRSLSKVELTEIEIDLSNVKKIVEIIKKCEPK